MRLPNVKMLLRWPSRMQIYGFVETHTFLEQFVSRRVPAQFSNLGVPAQFSNLGVPAQFFQSGGTSTIFQSGGTSTFWSISLVQVFSYNFMDCTKRLASYAWLQYGTNRWRVKPQHQAKADSSRLSIVN